MHTGRICGALHTKMADCPAWSISQGRGTHYMGADIEGDGRLGGDRSDPPVVDVCLPPDGQFHQPGSLRAQRPTSPHSTGWAGCACRCPGHVDVTQRKGAEKDDTSKN